MSGKIGGPSDLRPKLSQNVQRTSAERGAPARRRGQGRAGGGRWCTEGLYGCAPVMTPA